MRSRWLFHFWLVLLVVALPAFVGCKGDDGDDGKDGAPGAAGAAGESAYEIAVDNGFTGTATDWLLGQEDVGPEICSFCHNGEVARAGATHQEVYDELFQQGVIEVSNVTYSNDGTDDTVTFQMTMNGADLDCTTVDSLNIRFAQYDAATPTTTPRFLGDGAGGRLSLAGDLSYDAGTNTCTSVNAQTDLGDLSGVDGIIVVYGEDGQTDRIGHITLAKYPFAAMPYATGTFVNGDYESAANATGCEQCHQSPYYKHGYIRGDISAGGGLDFYACKVCHTSDADSHHADWRIAVDNPQRWAEIWNGADLTAAEEEEYGFKTRLMNDVHMSHAMEFPYPQSMRNCNTCHAGKLTDPDVGILRDVNFVLETCRSCHPVTGGTDTADTDGNFAVDTRDMALKTIWEEHGVTALHVQSDGSVTATACNACHHGADFPNAGDPVGIAPVFSALHTGYNPLIYTDSGTKYADAITASIDSVTVSGNTLDISVSATGTADSLSFTDIVPTIQVSFYGYDTKDFLVSNHTRDTNGDRMEKTIGTDNALFTEVDGDGSDGTWEVTLDMSAYAADPSIPDMIAAGTIKQAEVAFRPALDHPSITTVSHGGDVIPAPVGLNAVTKTVDVTGAGSDPSNYFQGDNALVTVQDTTDASGRHHGCNSCHDQLATTFHTGDRGGSIVVCRMCHVVTSGGSHLEGQSRSIDSYVLAIHRFQAFDVDNIDFTDPVEKARYEEHVEFLFPDFAAINCERCHTDSRAVDNGMRLPYDIPDQSKSMPGLLSGTDEIPGMAIPETPEVVVGPGARACGGCHRAQFLKEDDLEGYVAFNEHAKEFGYRVENDSNDNMLNAIIAYIMGMFQ